MRYLLDTNVLIYLTSVPDELTEPAYAVLKDPRTTLHASVVSFYEVGNKHRLRKLVTSPDKLAEKARIFGISFVPMTETVATEASLLDWLHRDPWDRIIAAQAMQLGATLLSSDRAFDALPGLTRLW